MGLERKRGLKNTINTAALSALMATAQPPMNPDAPSMKPAGVREALKKLNGPDQTTLPDGRRIVMNDTPPEKKKDSADA
jgi:hypothetical protein